MTPPGAADPPDQPAAGEPPADGTRATTTGSSGPRTTGRDLRAGLHTALAVTALGLPIGLLWGWLAPREDVRLSPGGAVSFVDAGGDLFVRDDLLYVLLACVAGLLAGALAHARAADRGWPVAVGLALGGSLGALLAVEVGERLGTGALVYEQGQLHPADGRPLPVGASGVLEVSLELRATGALVLLPLSAVLAHLSLQLARPRPEPVAAEGAGPPLSTSGATVPPPGDRVPGSAPPPATTP